MSDTQTIPEPGNGDPKVVRQEPTKSLPTDRLKFDKQTLILRGTAKASLAANRGAVANNEVAQYAGVPASSVSLCNAFFVESGLLVREGQKVRPTEAVFEFDQAAEWDPATAGTKLAPMLSATWFGKAMLTKLSLIPTTTVSEAVALLAMQCGASPEYKSRLEGLLDYLQFAGLITLDGNIVKRAARSVGEVTPSPTPSPSPTPAPSPPPAINYEGNTARRAKEGMKLFVVALPDKESVTVEFPEDFDHDDWILLAEQLVGYVRRWKKLSPPTALKNTIEAATSAPTTGAL